jgi:hypothetical protein
MTIQAPIGVEACKERLRATTAPDTLRSLFVPSGTTLCSTRGDYFQS